eukprot:1168436-Lingulodinium_polyedra.AAC.1
MLPLALVAVRARAQGVVFADASVLLCAGFILFSLRLFLVILLCAFVMDEPALVPELALSTCLEVPA